MNAPLIFSLWVSICPVNVSDINDKSCESVYHSGRYSAMECIKAQGTQLGKVTGKPFPYRSIPSQVRQITCEIAS
jgi:hypothetical protein